MQASKRPLWKKSMLQTLNFYEINSLLDEISENGDMCGYASGEKSEYYQEFKELFDELSDGAYRLYETLSESDVRDNWDDMTVALLGKTHTVLGFDTVEQDYYHMLNPYDEDFAVEEATKCLERLTKRDLIKTFRKVMVSLVLFFDIKCAHDCLTAIVEELDERGALLQQKYDKLFKTPQRMWVE